MANEVKIRTKKEGLFPIHELAALVPLATESEQAALTLSIKENGQQQPITLYKGAIVDGRCRQAALDILGHNIMYTELDDNLTEDQVAMWVDVNNTRRQLTPTQLAFTAAKQYLKSTTKTSLIKVAKRWSINKVTVTYAIWLVRNKPDVAELLFNGKKINIIVNGNPRTTFSVPVIYTYYKKQTEAAIEAKDTSYDGYEFENEVVKEFYFKCLSEGKTTAEMLDVMYKSALKVSEST